MPQPSLFDWPALPPYHKRGPPTEKKAAVSVTGSASSLRSRIYAFVRLRGAWGATRDEIDRAFNKTPNVTQPRLWELEGCSPYCARPHRHLPGLIEKTGLTRETRSGRQATVYVAIKRDG